MTAAALVVTPDDLDTLTRTLYGEARDQGLRGQIGVAWVVRIRASWDELVHSHPEHEWWGTTPALVCKHPWQFSCWNASDPNSAKLKALAVESPMYQWLYGVAKAVLAGTYDDPTGAATHYRVTGTKASWDDAVAHMTPVILGAHSFYRLGPDH